MGKRHPNLLAWQWRGYAANHRNPTNLVLHLIAGKSGTAQVVAIKQNERYDRSKLLERHRDHALFVGFRQAVAEMKALMLAAATKR